jgi:hypothetical protein
MVLTVEDSVSIGQMYYNPRSYDRSLAAMINVHLHGMRITNTGYPGGQTQLFKLIAYYHRKLYNEGFFGEYCRHFYFNLPKHRHYPKDSYPELNALKSQKRLKGIYTLAQERYHVPQTNQLIALCSAVEYSHLLTPQHSEAEPPLLWPANYTEDRRVSQIYAEWLRKQMCNMDVTLEKKFRDCKELIFSPKNANPNRRQRDYFERNSAALHDFEYGIYYNNNEHEMCQPPSKLHKPFKDRPWVGKRPNIPPASWWKTTKAKDYPSGLTSDSDS